ncbi:hypothetical protein [Persephonella sp. IF05-L8]|uniref:hypothetical protein n=1 Tax=Persephonella sp. IF05-L8 TaxID=1158338 RepID=UPI000496E0B7
MIRTIVIFITLSLFSMSFAQNKYCAVPPFLNTDVSPLVMLVMGKNHKLFFEAYNDTIDLDGDGRIDVGYNHKIDYYGYFDPYKCYSYQGEIFVPVRKTSDKYCDGEWSGNFLNWLTMSRIDLIRKVLYGGYRYIDAQDETVLEATTIPHDGHSWGKEYDGDDLNRLTPFEPPPEERKTLFCVASLKEGEPRLIRVLEGKDQNKSHRIWDWASKDYVEVEKCKEACYHECEYYYGGQPAQEQECKDNCDQNDYQNCDHPDAGISNVISNSHICGGLLDGEIEYQPNGKVIYHDYSSVIKNFKVRVKVCDKSVGLEQNCKKYPSGNYKPVGLLQKYGVDPDGKKICSKSYIECQTDDDCGANGGNCIPYSKIYFGLLTGSYEKNMSGGVLRKNVSSISEEIDPDTGQFKTDVHGIIDTLNKIKIVDFHFEDYIKTGNTDKDWAYGHAYGLGWPRAWKFDAPMEEGEFKSWGNPIAEMLYETVRYFSNKGNPSGEYFTDDISPDLPEASWDKPEDKYPVCAKPFIFVISDKTVNYDSDQLPGSYFNSGFSGDINRLDVSSLAEQISDEEGISNGSYFIGQSEAFTDFICSQKNISSLASIRGLCPEEPTKQGSFYSTAVSYYGNKELGIKTYTISLSTHVPNIKISLPAGDVNILPVGKSVSGCFVYDYCVSKCSTISYDEDKGLKLSNCQENAFCPSDPIIDFYIEDIQYTSDNKISYIKFRINFADVEQGGDYDMDAIVFYEIKAIDDDKVKVTITSTEGGGCVDQVFGLSISGTTEDGTYFLVKDGDVQKLSWTPDTIADMPLKWEHIFTVSSSSAQTLPTPLYLAAKWGGFDDKNDNDIPDRQDEWDGDGDGIPDTYFLITNPLKLEETIEKAFQNILKRTSSGTSVSVLSDRKTGGAVVTQATFHPEKTFKDTQDEYTVNWIGHLYAYWFFLTKNIQNLREDTNSNYYLDILEDRILRFYIDDDKQLKIDRCLPDKNGNPDTSNCLTAKSLDEISYLWDAGSKLKETQPEDRNIYAIEIGDDYEFTIDNLDSFKDFIGNLENTCLEVKDNDGDYDHEKSVENLIKYIRGEDIEGCRIRKVDNEGNTWKLGDIIYSTPLSVNYDNYSVVYVGANDGMLHAFKLGKVKKINSTSQVAQLCQDSDNCTSYEELGKELWAFIPKNILPYLRYLADTDYCHTYLVDLPPYLIEDNDKKILIGGLRLGGGCKEGIKPPTDTCSDPTNTSCVGLSSYFAIDITDPENPQFLWEFSHPDLGFSYSGPAYITRGNKKYVMFASGPQTYDGDIEEKFQELTLFILSLDEDFKITAVYRKNVQDQQNQNLQRTFSGRLFTRGIDVTVRDGLIINEPDGYTDLVFFGVNQINEGVKQGQLAVVVPKDDNPENWDIFANVLTVVSPGSGLVTKVEHMQCFNMNYIYFGTGRWFYKDDTPGTSSGETVEALYGIVIDDCLKNPTTDNCNFNTINNNDIGNTICDELSSNTSDNGNLRTGWRIELSGAADGYYKERVITDPTVTDQNVIFFTSMQPTSDICGFGGRTRVWALNCATGASVFDTTNTATCYGAYPTEFPEGKLLLQLSGGDIQQIGEKELNSSQHTDWYIGTPPNTAPPFVTSNTWRGELLLWIEK